MSNTVFFSREHSIHFIKPLHYIAHLLGLVPPYHLNRGGKLILYKCYCVLITILFNTFIIFSFYERIITMYQYMNVTTAVIDSCVFSWQIISICVSVYKSSFQNMNKFREMHDLFVNVDVLLNGGIINYKRKYKGSFCMELIAMNFIVIGTLIHDTIVSLSKGKEYFYSEVLSEIAHYHNLINVLLIYNYALFLKIRLRRMNTLLKCTFKSNMRMVHSEKSMVNLINQVRKIYTMLLEAAEVLNKLFGWQILFSIVTVGMVLLNIVDFAILAFLEEEPDIHEICIGSVWCFILLVSDTNEGVLLCRTFRN